MLLRNDMIEYVEPNAKVIRILWLHPEKPVAVIIDVDTEFAKPELIQVETLEEDLHSGKANLLTEDRFLTALKGMVLTEKMKKIRDKSWNVIKNLVSNEPYIYDPQWRGPKVLETATEHATSKPTIYKILD